MKTKKAEGANLGLTFQERYCLATRCKPEGYEWRVLRECRHFRARVPYFLVKWLAPHLFNEDLALIRQVATATSFSDFCWDVQAHWQRYPARGYWRRRWHLRLSQKRLLKLAQATFHPRAVAPVATEIWEPTKPVVLG